jgi:hypothetical protein
VFTTHKHFSVSWASWIQSMTPPLPPRIPCKALYLDSECVKSILRVRCILTVTKTMLVPSRKSLYIALHSSPTRLHGGITQKTSNPT